MTTNDKSQMVLRDGRSGSEFALDILHPTQGSPVIDIRRLHAESGCYTYNPGLTETGTCRSAITYVDGDNGILNYRGYPIDSLVRHSSALEVGWLLLNGELPTVDQLSAFSRSITLHTMLNEQIHSVYKGFRRDAHPMAIMCGVTGALAAFYHDNLDIFSKDHRMIAAHRLIAKVPTIAAMAYKYSVGQPFIYPRNDLGYVENFLHMMFSVPCEPYQLSDTAVRAIEAIMIIQADHEQNASTSTVRAVGSTRANPYACIAAGIASLWGPLHGGANEEALATLDEIKTIDNIPRILDRAKDKNDSYRLMGFGHRVYKSYDPRAVVLKEICHEVLASHGSADDPLLQVAMELEKAALSDPYFIERRLYPNVDFYSGIILRAIGFPPSMFTPLFAVSRTLGWVSHWIEMITDPETKITRPRQLYVGSPERPYKQMSERRHHDPVVG